MTTVTFRSDAGGRVAGFTVSGHSGLAPAGADVLCAAVTSAVRLTECALNDVLGLEVPVRVRPKTPSVTLRLPDALDPEQESLCQTLLAALMVHLSRLQEEYPDYLIVLNTEV